MCHFTIFGQTTRYIKPTASGTGDGSSWANASADLQAIIDASAANDIIWVAGGIYKPTQSPDGSATTRNYAFHWNTDIKIYGGFAGTETALSERDWITNETILSGDLNGDDNVSVSETSVTFSNYSENTYHVIVTNLLTTASELDGFTIRGGNADATGSSIKYTYGTGLFFAQYCGGMYNGDSAPSVTNVKFLYNYSKNSSAAIYNYDKDPVFRNIIVAHNKTDYRAIMLNAGSSVTIINSTFAYNHIAGTGSQFIQNAGAIYNTNSATPTITNTIFWKNTQGGSSTVVNADITDNGATSTVTYCLTQQNSNFSSGTGIINNQDPVFIDALNNNFRISSASPTVTKGNVTAWNATGLTKGYYGNARPINGSVGIGAYEDDCDCYTNHTVGTNAGSNITTGYGNTIYGEEAGQALTAGYFNSLMGYRAGYSLTTADSSIMMGAEAGYSTTTGSRNIFMGSQTGYNTTTGYNNIFVGEQAGRYNTTGYNNIAIGQDAGEALSTGFNNILIGEHNTGYSGIFSGRDNIFIGQRYIQSKTTASHNTAMGNEITYGPPGDDLTTGMYNTLFGSEAGSDVGTGNWNTFVGVLAGKHTEHTNYNTFVGYGAGWDNNRNNSLTTGQYNTYVGSECGYNIRLGDNNVGIGADATTPTGNYSNATFIGANSYFENQNITLIGAYTKIYADYGLVIGNYSRINNAGGIGLGYSTLISANYGVGIGYQDTISGAYGVTLGYQATVDNQYGVAIGKQASAEKSYGIAIGANTKSLGENAIAIGYNIQVSGNHEMYLGNTSTTSIGGTVDYTALSDGRFKTNIQENVVGLDFIRQLRPVSYELRVASYELGNRQQATRNRYTGFIAQEVEQAALNSNFEFSGVDYRAGIDRYGLRYAEFVVPLVKAVQELNPKIEEQKATIQSQEAQLDTYHQRLLELKAELDDLKKQ